MQKVIILFHFNVIMNIIILYKIELIIYTGTIYQDLTTPLDNTYDWKMHDLNNTARNTLKRLLQNRKINVFILCCKNMMNWKREIRPISSYAGHLFHHEKYTIAFCTSVTDVLAWMNPYQQVKYHFDYFVPFQTEVTHSVMRQSKKQLFLAGFSWGRESF